jgi:uncharacterized Zn-binding protein involved in type VI secretion
MPAAARVGDVSNHGGIIAGPGVATVLIGGLPALRITDACNCGAMAAAGEPTVIIG